MVKWTAKSSQLARKPFNCLTTTAQSPNNNKTSWRELGENLSLSKFKPMEPTRAKWEAPNDTQLGPSWKLGGPSWKRGSRWLELGVGQGLKAIHLRFHFWRPTLGPASWRQLVILNKSQFPTPICPIRQRALVRTLRLLTNTWWRIRPTNSSKSTLLTSSTGGDLGGVWGLKISTRLVRR